MNEREKKAIQKNLIDLIHNVNPNDITPYLFQDDQISRSLYEEILDLNVSRGKLCQLFIRRITSNGSKCKFESFLRALSKSYHFLSEKIKETLANIEENQNLQTEEQLIYRRKEVSEPNNDNHVKTHTSRSQETITEHAIIYQPVKKINVFTENRRRISMMSHRLKRLNHDGDVDKFRKFMGKISDKFSKHKLDRFKNIKPRMNLADMKFTSLEAEASFKRVNYDVNLSKNPIFEEMKSTIPFTTNPQVSSMTYLARYGSAISMLESLDVGLGFLQYSKHHAEHVVPCKETGMVFYIEVNLLSQKYEQNPSDNIKKSILKTAELAISQFSGEDENVQKDYQRMLMLKMVFCRLGIGLFGKRINSVKVDDSDREAAKNYMDFIEKPDIWEGMEKRRKMLFQIAKSEFYRQHNQIDLARMHAREAAGIAEENKWNAELPNIKKLINELENHIEPITKQENEDIDDWINELENDSEEIGENNKFV